MMVAATPPDPTSLPRWTALRAFLAFLLAISIEITDLARDKRTPVFLVFIHVKRHQVLPVHPRSAKNLIACDLGILPTLECEAM